MKEGRYGVSCWCTTQRDEIVLKKKSCFDTLEISQDISNKIEDVSCEKADGRISP